MLFEEIFIRFLLMEVCMEQSLPSGSLGVLIRMRPTIVEPHNTKPRSFEVQVHW